MAQAPRDENRITTLLGTSNADGTTPVTVYADPTTHRLLVSISGSLTILTATGTVDDSNTSFSFASAPTLVVINGALYRDGHGYTLSGLNITTDSPVGVGGDIFGIA